MTRPGRKPSLVAGMALIALALSAPAARADDSQIRISEVYSDGSAAHGDFVELQMLADGQAIPGTGAPGGAAIQVCNSTHAVCTPFFDFPTHTLPAALSQRTVLIGWDDNAATDFGIAAGFNIPVVGGDVCYYSSTGPNVPRDCVAWGTSTGNAPSVGNPAPAMNASQSLTRTEARGCPTLMEAVDDTDDSAADFSLATPSPRNNFGTPSEVNCPVPAPPVTVAKKKCKKKKKKANHSAAAAKKKKCKKRKK